MTAFCKIFISFAKLYFLAFLALLWDTFSKHKKFKDKTLGHEGKVVAIVTGGTSGIGLCVTRRLAKMGAHVIVGAHKEQEADAVRADLVKDTPHAKVDFVQMDLSSLTSVRTFVQDFEDRELPLHILINNAGVMFPPYTKTEDGFELQLATNYLGPFLLTQLLLPKLKRCGSAQSYSRIVNVSSVAHFAGNMDFDNLHAQNYYSSHGAYCQSKLAINAWTYKLQDHLQSEDAYVTANCLNPGLVNTRLYRHVTLIPQWFKTYVHSIILKTPDQAADVVLHAALAPELEARGALYLDNCRETRSKSVTYDRDVQNQLWTASMRLVGMEDKSHFIRESPLKQGSAI